MTYKQVIDTNCLTYYPNWWPKYAYHFTDVTNIVSILSSGMLYSRTKATQIGVMENDNASKQVIDITDVRTTSSVRFYFRPQTPTQYNNEGFKHIQLRYNDDIHANIPVPVFLVFDLETLLQTEGVQFSELSLAGHGNMVYQGEEKFAKLSFDKIYSIGPCDNETLRYRHAEIICPDCYSIEESLRMILCRNECEKATLINMLSDCPDQMAYYKYNQFIRVAHEGVFQRNGLFVDNVNYHNNSIAFEFACTPEKKYYERRKNAHDLAPICTSYKFQWSNKQGKILFSTVVDRLLDYMSPQPVMFKLPNIAEECILEVKLFFEDKIVCVFKRPINSFEMI